MVLVDFGLSVVAEFSLREDALMILGVYSGTFLRCISVTSLLLVVISHGRVIH